MNANEKIYVKSAWFETFEDDYERGELAGSRGSSWTGKDVSLKDGPYCSVEEAVKAVCDANCFKFDKAQWEFNGTGDNPGLCESGFMVDENNCEADADDIEAWKRRETRLWYCTAAVRLEIRACRQLTAEEAKF